MNKTTQLLLGHSLVLGAAATLFSGCTDDMALGPGREAPYQAEFLARQTAAPVNAVAMGANSGNPGRGVDLGECEILQVPARSKLVFRAYANGVQIYHWNGTGWSFDAPLAVLTADAQGNGVIGTHYEGPTWESVSGSKVVGAVLQRCTPDPSSIPWLLLSAESTGPGIFHRVTFIQRVNTVGGNAPSESGSFIGEEARVPYTTEYLFYRTE